MSVYVSVTVDDPAALLNTSLFGAGALGRWEYSSDNGVLVPFQEGGTFALVNTTTLYTFYDLAGTPTMWNRLRYSTATPTLTKHYSGYGAAFSRARRASTPPPTASGSGPVAGRPMPIPMTSCALPTRPMPR